MLAETLAAHDLLTTSDLTSRYEMPASMLDTTLPGPFDFAIVHKEGKDYFVRLQQPDDPYISLKKYRASEVELVKSSMLESDVIVCVGTPFSSVATTVLGGGYGAYYDIESTAFGMLQLPYLSGVAADQIPEEVGKVREAYMQGHIPPYVILAHHKFDEATPHLLRDLNKAGFKTVIDLDSTSTTANKNLHLAELLARETGLRTRAIEIGTKPLNPNQFVELMDTIKRLRRVNGPQVTFIDAARDQVTMLLGQVPLPYPFAEKVATELIAGQGTIIVNSQRVSLAEADLKVFFNYLHQQLLSFDDAIIMRRESAKRVLTRTEQP